MAHWDYPWNQLTLYTAKPITKAQEYSGQMANPTLDSVNEKGCSCSLFAKVLECQFRKCLSATCLRGAVKRELPWYERGFTSNVYNMLPFKSKLFALSPSLLCIQQTICSQSSIFYSLLIFWKKKYIEVCFDRYHHFENFSFTLRCLCHAYLKSSLMQAAKVYLQIVCLFVMK